MNIFENIKKFFVDGIQKAGGKITKDLLKNVQIQGSGKIVINIGTITIKGQELNVKLIDVDNKNNILTDINIPLNITITPGDMEIPVEIKGDLK